MVYIWTRILGNCQVELFGNVLRVGFPRLGNIEQSPGSGMSKLKVGQLGDGMSNVGALGCKSRYLHATILALSCLYS